MGRVRWQDRIVIAPDLHHGDPCIKGTRIPVAVIVGSLADGMASEEIREAYPQLTDEDIQAALAYAAEVIHQDILVPVPVERMEMRSKADSHRGHTPSHSHPTCGDIKGVAIHASQQRNRNPRGYSLIPWG